MIYNQAASGYEVWKEEAMFLFLIWWISWFSAEIADFEGAPPIGQNLNFSDEGHLVAKLCNFSRIGDSQGYEKYLGRLEVINTRCIF